MTVLVQIEHDRGQLVSASHESVTFARELAARLGAPLHALTVGAAADGTCTELARFGVEVVHQAHHEQLTDYGPDASADALVALIGTLAPTVVVACGTDRGNEVLAHTAARLDLPFAANVLPDDLEMADDRWELTRVRWGGSLRERAELTAPLKLLTVALHAVDPAAADPPGAGSAEPFTPPLGELASVTLVRDRVEREAGVTLATATVVVGGGRGVGSAEGFLPLEELAAELGGVVGCSRAVTNNGWRNHTDQVGQTGTRIGADLYLACGISGAIQHWVGASGAKCIVAVNTDRDANMVTKADYAVIGDLHEIVPAVTAEIRRRRSG
ncbi:MAG: electron transfer flavoprotein subunit alpha/FixB family protein [Acidimicrobiia bacterium]